jgi:hypothetical protein
VDYRSLPGLIELQTLVRRSLAFAGRSLAVVVVVGSLDDIPMDAHADDFTTNTSVYVATNLFTHKSDTGWDTFATAAASAEIELVLVDNPLHVSIFNDPGRGELKMAFYLPVGQAGQLRIVAGTQLREGWSPSARLEFSWLIN